MGVTEYQGVQAYLLPEVSGRNLTSMAKHCALRPTGHARSNIRFNLCLHRHCRAENNDGELKMTAHILQQLTQLLDAPPSMLIRAKSDRLNGCRDGDYVLIQCQNLRY